MSKELPKDLTHDPERPWWPEMCRNIREQQWEIMQAAADHGAVWVNPWNNRRLPETEDTYRFGLLGWQEMASWFQDQHSDWFEHGEWDDERCAAPIRLTDAGRQALQERDRYDMDAVFGGMVEPGWTCLPAERRPRRFRVFQGEGDDRSDLGELICYDNGGSYRRKARIAGTEGIVLEEVLEEGT